MTLSRAVTAVGDSGPGRDWPGRATGGQWHLDCQSVIMTHGGRHRDEPINILIFDNLT